MPGNQNVTDEPSGVPLSLPNGWFIAETGGEEIVVCAPNAMPGGMTIPAGDGGTLSVRLLRSLCKAILSNHPTLPTASNDAH